MTADLKSCPFCGGDAEMDTQQGYTNFATGRRETGIAIYCRDCGVQHMICRGDVPDVEPEHVIELWNRRVPPVGGDHGSMGGWKPIESAPRDGTLIDVWCFNPYAEEFNEPTTCIRLTDVAWHDANDTVPHTGWVRVLDDGNCDFVDGPPLSPLGLPRWTPTHWQPLPPPPVSSETDGGEG